MLISPESLATLARIDALGSFEAAARDLNITASAVSQRMKTLEQQVGRVLVVRSKPAALTEAGRVLVRLARQFDLLEREALDELGVQTSPGRHSSLAIAINGDSLATWIHPALARFSLDHPVVLDIVRDDQEHTAALLASGRVLAAVTSDPAPVSGCTSSPLGSMRYRAVAAPAFITRWFDRQVDARSLGAAPRVDFDRKDSLQTRWMRAVTRADIDPPRHFVPSSADFASSVVAGMGWGMLPDAQCADHLQDGTLVELRPGTEVAVRLHWQQWDLRSRLLDSLADEVRRAARAALV